MARYKFTQESGTTFKVNTSDKCDALEDTNEIRQILDDLGELLGHSKFDDAYPKDATAGGTLTIPATAGGTGVQNNILNTITFTGAFTLGLTLTANTALTLPTSGTLATTSNKLSAFAATTSAELAGVISDETGTLKLVFADSPTFTTKITTPQIAFPAEQSASANANTLDDYEEGTWTVIITPATSGTVTLDAAFDTGRYTKIGSMVHAHGQIKIASVSSPVGYAKVNLPFASADLTDASEKAMGNIAFSNVDYVATGWVTTDIFPGGNYFYLLGVSDNAPWVYEAASIFSAGDYMGFTITYVVD